MPDTPRILLLMTTRTYRAQAFLDAAVRLGVAVTVGTDQPSVAAMFNPAGNLDLTFHDLEEDVEAITTFAKQYPLNAVIAAEDEGTLTAAMSAETLGLRHSTLSAVGTARNKLAMRRALHDARLLTPWFRQISISAEPESLVAEIPYPCVVKPLALSGSRGVIRVDTPTDFSRVFRLVRDILRAASPEPGRGLWQDELLIEGYIPGAEAALEGLLTDGELRVLAIFDKPDPLIGPYFEETIYVTPSRHLETVQQNMITTTQAACTALGLTEGPIHAEMRLNDAGVWMLEVAPRSIGGYCSKVLRFEDNFTLESVILRHALGGEIASRTEDASGVMMIPIPHAGVLRGVRGIDEAKLVPDIEDVMITVPVGQTLIPLPYGAQYLGFIFARSRTPEAAETALRTAHAHLTFAIEDER